MIWQFGELGWEYSIFTCNNGTVNTSNDAIAGDCKLDTKPFSRSVWMVIILVEMLFTRTGLR
jgi:hypothetical protein